ncbi:hypothetical protein OIU76_005769 [Salix suchowensis]|nr:hypothetical protein OIU76_005769 [Salix suchowensis]
MQHLWWSRAWLWKQREVKMDHLAEGPRHALASKTEEKPRGRAKEADAIFVDHKLHQDSYVGNKWFWFEEVC